MKKYILLLLLYFFSASSFSQNIIFQDNFEKGKLNKAWKIAGQSTVANLENEGIKPPADGNNFALKTLGNAQITLDVPVENTSVPVTTQCTFNYWIHYIHSKVTVNILFLNSNGTFISSANLGDLAEKTGWDLFNQKVDIPAGSSIMQLKLLVARASSTAGNSVYFQSICFGCNRRR